MSIQRAFSTKEMQMSYDYYMTLSVDALAVLIIRLREHAGEFERADPNKGTTRVFRRLRWQEKMRYLTP